MNRPLPRPHTLIVQALLLLAIPFVSSAQQGKFAETQKRLSADKRIEKAIVDPQTATPSMIKLASFVKRNEAPALMKQLLQTDPNTSFRTKNVQENKTGVAVEKFQQYYKNVKVQHGIYSVIARGENVEAFTGRYYPLNNINTVPGMTEQDALVYAKAFVGANKYAWEQAKEARDAETDPLKKQLYNAEYEKLLPKAELVIVQDYSNKGVFDLAYKFDIYAADPLTRGYAYVNAHTGKIMLYDKIIKHVNPDLHNNKMLSGLVPEVAGIAAMKMAANSPDKVLSPTASVLTVLPTRYAGNRTVGTKLVSGNDPSGNGALLVSSNNSVFAPGSPAYVLIDDTHHSQSEQTYDLNGVGGAPVSLPVYGQAKSFTDQDNNWTLAEHNRGGQNNEAENDDYVFDAHWGATVVYDYWNNVHGRKSFDNLNSSIKSYAHYGAAYDNAFWNGSVMTYGDGSYQGGAQAGFAPLTSLDVCGHEIGHGVCSNTADLVYEGESGAMNEGFSDVWAASIENYTLANIDATLASNPVTRPNGYKIWSIGEQIDANDLVSGTTGPNRPSSDPLSTALRYMDTPNKAGDPAFYAEKTPASGTRRWKNPNCTAPNVANDQCGVHTNSGVLNHLFYILTMGETGTVNTLMAENTSGAVDGAPFNVAGVGFEKSQKIMYLTEQLLTPSATFLDARNAAVLAAEILYGKCSGEWKQTIIAWNAVAVGASSDTAICSILPKFSVAIDNLIDESTAKSAVNCTDATKNLDLAVNILAPGFATPVTVSIETAGTATLNKDYTLQASTVNYAPNTSGLQKVVLSVYNDAEVEADETIILNIHAADGAGFSKDTTVTVTIKDDDRIPVINNSRVNILTEYFDGTANDAVPSGWATIDKLGGASTVIWKTVPSNSYPGFPTKAATVTLNTPGVYTSSYDPANPGNVLLRTPLINAGPYSDLAVTFRWAAGGEPDGAVPPQPLDYGRLLYSYNGTNFQPLEFNNKQYAFQSTATKDSVILPNQLAGKSFYLAFEWYNDDLFAVNPSFIIDSMIVSGGGQKIETAAGEAISEKQFQNKDIYYKSAQDGQVIAHIYNNNQDLGCVNAVLTSAGNGPNATPITFGSNIYQRAERVVTITPSPVNTTANYTIELFVTTAELAGMNPAAIQILKVKDGVALNGTISNTDGSLGTTTFQDHSADGYYSYTASFTGFSQFVLVQQAAVVAQSLLDFTAAAQDNKFIRLNWKAVNETAGSYTLERAEKGSASFKAINMQSMQGGASVREYVFDDHTAQPNITYQYRLRINENNGQRYSQIRFASLNGKAQYVEIAPNPSDGMFNVYLHGYKGQGQISVYDASGRQLIQRKQLLDTDPRVPVDLTKQSPGVYTLKLQTDRGSEAFKLIVR